VGQVDHGGDVDHDLLVVALGGDRVEAALRGEAGVVDEDVDLASELLQATRHRLRRVLAREVFGDDLDPDSVGLVQARRRFAQALIRARDQHQINLTLGERVGERRADSRGRAGDERGLAGEAHALSPRAPSAGGGEHACRARNAICAAMARSKPAPS